MPLQLNKEQIEAVLKLTPEARYEHFMKRVADTEEVWSLYDDGWALLGDERGCQIFPLWPSVEYAEKCISGTWSGYKTESLPLQEVRDGLLPALKRDGILIGVFYTPDNKGIVVEVDDFLNHLNYELSRY